ncbi:MAG TPA: hypothetical protein ENH13_04675 [Euryarchaeota archaeon]|nr:hypothetical protein BMS3Bbin16_00096 [archaeon BMS3Bbin16]HDH28407.1 hypothetical protein [Euryarchaeota archaeon]
MERLEPLVRELGLENRIFILKMLKDRGKSVAQIRKELKASGVSKPFSTVGRYVKSLEDLHLVCEVRNEFYLSLKGRLVLRWIESLEPDLSGFEGVEEFLFEYPIDYLADELLFGVHVLGLAERVDDTFNVMWNTVNAVNSAEKEVLLVNTDIINREFGELAVEKCVKGLRLSAVVYSSTVKERIDMLNDIIKEKGICGSSLKVLKENFVFKSIDGTAPNLIIADDTGAGISLPNPEGVNSLTPAFKSADNEFIDWVRSIFVWHWDRGELVTW